MKNEYDLTGEYGIGYTNKHQPFYFDLEDFDLIKGYSWHYANKGYVDHFIPWSFVVNDELWNLMPMDSLLNLSKSNRLPKWDPFFIRFAKNQFIMYRLIHEKDGIRKLYESYYRYNLHSIWAGQELYRKGNSEEEFMNILQKNMQPIYDSARRQGYEVWNRG